MNRIGAMAFVQLQRILPRYLLTGIVNHLTRIRLRPLKNFLIRRFIAAYDVDIDELDRAVPDDYQTFNDFFTRELAAGRRPVDPSPSAFTSPVDGSVSAVGSIEKDLILQAKGIYYSVPDLLATDLQDADHFVDGEFVTIYLAPFNYHRVHSPVSGELVAARYVPGDLFSVNAATVSHLPRLFEANERLVCHFDTDCGPMILVFVGAMNVGSISTRWTGEIRPRKTGVVQDINIRDTGVEPRVSRGDPLGCFNMGSTVVILMPPGSIEWRPDLVGGSAVRMGEAIGTMMNKGQ